MTDYQITASTRRCAATGRDLKPGEKVYTVLLDRDGKFVRQDYAGEAWTGMPADAFSFWVGRVTSTDEARKPRIDDELLMDCFRRLEGQYEPERVHFRYVVALLLMRRKRLKFEEAGVEQGQEVLRLRDVRGRQTHEVVNPRLTDAQMTAVQDEVFKVLGWE